MCDNNFSSFVASLFSWRCLAASTSFFAPRGHEPPPNLRDRLNPHLSLQRRRFPILRYAKRPDVALYAIGPLFLLPTPYSPHCTLKVSEHDSLWQSPGMCDTRRIGGGIYRKVYRYCLCVGIFLLYNKSSHFHIKRKTKTKNTGTTLLLVVLVINTNDSVAVPAVVPSFPPFYQQDVTASSTVTSCFYVTCHADAAMCREGSR